MTLKGHFGCNLLCMPVFKPQIVGRVVPVPPVAMNVSVQVPPPTSVVPPVPRILNVSKSRRRSQMSKKNCVKRLSYHVITTCYYELSLPFELFCTV